MVKQKNLKFVWIALLSLLTATFFVSLFLGRYWISPEEVGRILIDRLRGLKQDGMAASVVWGIRMPRTLLNVLVGPGWLLQGRRSRGFFRIRW